MPEYQTIITKIFDAQDSHGFWKILPVNDKHYPTYLHYIPNFRASLWTLILLADLRYDKNDERVLKPLNALKNHFFDKKTGIYSLKDDHFPIPCLNGNMVYLDCYFNEQPDERSLSALSFFSKYQRFDDGTYELPKTSHCSNTSCYGKHSCYWGIIKLLKGMTFLPKKSRSHEIQKLLDKCINFILLHNVCFSSHSPNKFISNKIDLLTFPNMYKSDFLEILWLLKREKVVSDNLKPALKLLLSKRQPNDKWKLERLVKNMLVSIGAINQPNPFITNRANEVLLYYSNKSKLSSFL